MGINISQGEGVKIGPRVKMGMGAENFQVLDGIFGFLGGIFGGGFSRWKREKKIPWKSNVFLSEMGGEKGIKLSLTRTNIIKTPFPGGKILGKFTLHRIISTSVGLKVAFFEVFGCGLGSFPNFLTLFFTCEGIWGCFFFFWPGFICVSSVFRGELSQFVRGMCLNFNPVRSENQKNNSKLSIFNNFSHQNW